MPVEIPPERIEISQLDGGFSPDPVAALVPLNAAPDMLNLLPDPFSHNPEVRKGFERVTNGVLSQRPAFYIKHIRYYEYIDDGARERRLVCVLTNGLDNVANNVQLWEYDLKEETFERIDTAGEAWLKANTPHWYAVVEGIYYGGTRGEKIYKWNGTTWNADPTTPDVKEWVDDIGDTPNLTTEYPRNYAFKAKTVVEFDNKWYTSARNIRYKTWESGEHYSKGEKISRKVDHGSNTYWRSFQCVDEHASSADNRPGDGTGTPSDYWKNVKLKDVRDEDDELTDDWNYNPIPAKSQVGTYHGFRMWVRRDDEDMWTRVQYSEPSRPEKNEDIADFTWRPTRWAFVDDTDGDGGGYINIPFRRGDAIRALVSYGNYLLIFGRYETHTIAGTNEQTWTVRAVDTSSGTLGIDSVCEHEGLVYYLTPGGMLYVTDGTASKPVENTQAVREYLKDLIDQSLDGEDISDDMPVMWSYGRKLWMSFPGTGVTLVYDTEAGSWWRTDLSIHGVAVGPASRATRMFFSTHQPSIPAVYVYRDDPGDEVFTDDDPDAIEGPETQTPIPVLFRSAWFEFGQVRAERRIRRTWALLAGEDGLDVALRTYRNFDDEVPVATADRELADARRAEFIEGLVPDGRAYSIALELEAEVSDDFSITGFGVDTEEVGDRFHRG